MACKHNFINTRKGEALMKNKKIRDALYHANMKQWQLAKLMQIREETLSRKLRDELPAEEQKQIVKLIKEATQEKG